MDTSTDLKSFNEWLTWYKSKFNDGLPLSEMYALYQGYVRQYKLSEAIDALDRRDSRNLRWAQGEISR